MARLQRREGALKTTDDRNRLAAEIRARRTGKPVEQPGSQWTEQEISEVEAGDRAFQEQLDELRRLKDRLLP